MCVTRRVGGKQTRSCSAALLTHSFWPACQQCYRWQAVSEHIIHSYCIYLSSICHLSVSSYWLGHWMLYGRSCSGLETFKMSILRISWANKSRWSAGTLRMEMHIHAPIGTPEWGPYASFCQDYSVIMCLPHLFSKNACWHSNSTRILSNNTIRLPHKILKSYFKPCLCCVQSGKNGTMDRVCRQTECTMNWWARSYGPVLQVMGFVICVHKYWICISVVCAPCYLPHLCDTSAPQLAPNAAQIVCTLACVFVRSVVQLCNCTILLLCSCGLVQLQIACATACRMFKPCAHSRHGSAAGQRKHPCNDV